MMCTRTQGKLVAVAVLTALAAAASPVKAGDLVPGGWAHPIHAPPPAPPAPPAHSVANRPQARPVAQSRANPVVSRPPTRHAPTSDGKIQY